MPHDSRSGLLRGTDRSDTNRAASHSTGRPTEYFPVYMMRLLTQKCGWASEWEIQLFFLQRHLLATAF